MPVYYSAGSLPVSKIFTNRSAMAEGEPLIQIHGITIDLTRWEISVEGKPITLAKSEFLLLRFLASHPGVDHSRQQIIDGTGGPDYPVTARSVDVQVTGLRKKLGDLGQLIETVRGVGYRFRPAGSSAGEASSTTLTAESPPQP